MQEPWHNIVLVKIIVLVFLLFSKILIKEVNVCCLMLLYFLYSKFISVLAKIMKSLLNYNTGH